MDPAPGLFVGVADALAAVMLLLEFGMLRQALVRDQVRLYAAQSALISVLAVVIAADRGLPDLYALAALSGALKVVAVPYVLGRLLPGQAGRRTWGSLPREGEPAAGWQSRDEPPGVAGSHTLSPASAVLASIALAAFGFFSLGSLRMSGFPVPVPVTALALAGAMIFVAFGLMIIRRDVASQAVGFFSLENAISLAALVVAAGLPLILEIAFLFDVLVAVVVFGMLIRVHHGSAGSLSTADLTRLKG
jgi:hydrogenase-4 component E